MVQIIEENRRPQADLGTALRGLVGAAGQFQQRKQFQQQQEQQTEAIRRAFGEEVAGLPPDLQKAYITEKLKGSRPLNELQQAQKGLAEARTAQAQGQTGFLDQLLGQQQLQEQIPKQSQGLQEFEQISQQPDQMQRGRIDPRNPQTWPEDALKKAAGFKGQPGASGVIGNIAQSELDRREKAEERSTKEKTQARKEEIEFHKESAKYDEELLKNYKSSQSQLNAINDVEKALKSGNVKPSSLANIFRSFGSVGKRISDALLSGDEATVLASIPAFLEGRKELFGVRLSDADLRLLQDKLPDIGKSLDANKKIVNLMKKYSEMSQLRYKIGSELKNKNNGLRPIGYPDRIEERFEEMIQSVNIISPKTGNIIQIPAYKLSDALEAGAALANE